MVGWTARAVRMWKTRLSMSSSLDTRTRGRTLLSDVLAAKTGCRLTTSEIVRILRFTVERLLHARDLGRLGAFLWTLPAVHFPERTSDREH